MRPLLTIIFGSLILLSGVAYYLRPKPPSDGKIHMTWWTPFNPYRKEQVETFNQEHPDLSLKATHSFSWKTSSLQKNILQCSTGLGPDLYDSNDTQMESYVASGVAMDITEQAKAGGFSKDDMWPTLADSMFVDGKQYAYPANTSVTILVYNKNIFDRFGLAYPKGLMTWEEFFQLAQKLRYDGNSIADSIFPVNGLEWLVFFCSERGEYFSENGTRVLLNSDSMKRAFHLHMDCQNKYRISPTSLESTSMLSQGGENASSAAVNLFADGHFAMNIIGKWALFHFRQTYENQKKALARWEANPQHDPSKKPELLRLGSVMLPHFANQPPAYFISGRTVVVNSKSPNREKALQFLKYMANPKYCSLITLSIDNLPPNPHHSEYFAEGAIPDLSEEEMHQNTLESMNYGYKQRKSPFLLSAEVRRILGDQIQRLEANNQLDVESVLNDAQDEAEKLMQRTIDRDPQLCAQYKKFTGTTDVHQAHLTGNQTVVKN